MTPEERALLPITPAKGEAMPRTIEHFEKRAIYDQELILDQKEENGRLKRTINQLRQKLNGSNTKDMAKPDH